MIIRKKTKHKTVSKLKKELDDLVRKLFKLKYGDLPTCCCCGLTIGWFHPKTNPYGMQVGHYIGRGATIIRYYEDESEAVAFINFITTGNAQDVFESI